MNWRKYKQIKKLLRLVSRFQTSIVLALVGLALIGTGLSISKIFSNSQEPTFVPADQQSEERAKIMIDIEGAVADPGLHQLDSAARMNDAIEVAGGFTKKADKSWVSKNLNLAAKLSDGQKIYIPAIGEVGGNSKASGQVASEISGKININTATEAQLDTLPGIGPVRAGKIIAGRPYSTLEELRTKNVLGESTFEKIKNLITVN